MWACYLVLIKPWSRSRLIWTRPWENKQKVGIDMGAEHSLLAIVCQPSSSGSSQPLWGHNRSLFGGCASGTACMALLPIKSHSCLLACLLFSLLLCWCPIQLASTKFNTSLIRTSVGRSKQKAQKWRQIKRSGQLPNIIANDHNWLERNFIYLWSAPTGGWPEMRSFPTLAAALSHPLVSVRFELNYIIRLSSPAASRANRPRPTLSTRSIRKNLACSWCPPPPFCGFLQPRTEHRHHQPAKGSQQRPGVKTRLRTAKANAPPQFDMGALEQFVGSSWS